MSKMLTRIQIVIWCLALPLWAFANVEMPKPLPKTSVHDFAGVIADDQEKEIQAKARRLEDEYKTEIAVVTIQSLGGENSFDYSMRMARSWGIGSPDSELRGILILVSVGDRKTEFRTSRHIEGELPDGVTGDISRQMNARFKSGDFGGGLSLALDKILERLRGVYEPPAARSSQGANNILLWLGLGFVALAGGIGLLIFTLWKKAGKRERQRQRQQAIAEGRRNYFAVEKPSSPRQTGQKTRQQREWRATRKQQRREQERARRQQQEAYRSSSYATSSGSSYDNSSSSYSSSYDSSSSSSSYDSGSSYDSSSSSSSDSGSSYSGGSDFGGGGSSSDW